jgi:hypothetical protein
MAGRIFVNYRRDDARADARGIYKALVEKFGERGVFMDVRDLTAGQEFDAVIATELDRCDVLIVPVHSICGLFRKGQYNCYLNPTHGRPEQRRVFRP